MKKIIMFIPLFVSLQTLAAPEIPSCSINEGGNLTGTYNAIQQQAYDSSCEIQHGIPPNNKVVPIGNNGEGVTSRIKIVQMPNTGGLAGDISLKLNGPEDNTLSGGVRGREEVASCYITESEFSALTSEEQEFRRVSSDFYRGCSQATGKSAVFDFFLMFEDVNNTYTTWDSIVMQLHAQNDKDKYCIPSVGISADICNIHNGTVGTVERTAEAYNTKLSDNAIFEKKHATSFILQNKRWLFFNCNNKWS